jgi:hypothetical protein
MRDLSTRAFNDPGHCNCPRSAQTGLLEKALYVAVGGNAMLIWWHSDGMPANPALSVAFPEQGKIPA